MGGDEEDPVELVRLFAESESDEFEELEEEFGEVTGSPCAPEVEATAVAPMAEAATMAAMMEGWFFFLPPGERETGGK